jgi:dolichol-phosphate mannosyltransferase
MTSSLGPSPGFASVVLPTYNERDNIVPLLQDLHAVIECPHELIVVDDNSPDGTSQAVQAFIDAGAAFVRLETRMADRGLTNSINRGIEIAKGDIICWMDCDFSHPPASMAELIHIVTHGKQEIAVASRYVPGGSYKKGLGWFGADESALAVLLSRLINWFIHIALDPRFHDYTSGFIAIRKDVLAQFLPLKGNYGEYFMDLMYRAIKTHHNFVEVPFISPPRRYGQSKTGTTFRQLFSHGKRYLRVIWRLWKYRPPVNR